MNRFGLPIALLIVLALPGCLRTPNIIPKDEWYQSLRSTRVNGHTSLNLQALDIIAALAALAAAATLILWAMRIPIPPRLSAACIVMAVAAWTLKYALATYMWLIAPLALAALVLFCLVLYRANSPAILESLSLHRRARSPVPPSPPPSPPGSSDAPIRPEKTSVPWIER